MPRIGFCILRGRTRVPRFSPVAIVLPPLLAQSNPVTSHADDYCRLRVYSLLNRSSLACHVSWQWRDLDGDGTCKFKSRSFVPTTSNSVVNRDIRDSEWDRSSTRVETRVRHVSGMSGISESSEGK